MLKYYLYYCIILSSYEFSSSIISVNAVKALFSDRKSVVKRNDNDLQVCLDNFDIHTDKIIRTQDSRAMGAKYINERDVASREDCLRLCCGTESCDVFVFEEKSPGSCYLFECGSPEDFKCKFTKHRNYTSAVLAVNRHLTELETQIKFTQHEHELTKLRDSVMSASTIVSRTTTEPPGSKETMQLVPAAQNSDQQYKQHECSRYQFTCHTSGECIAIYNACDGIPQCADGSDEAPELGCPSQTSTTKPVVATMLPPIAKSVKPEIDVQLPKQYPANPEGQWSSHEQYSMRQQQQNEGGVGYGVGQSGQPTNSRLGYGREGEGLAQQPSWANYQQYHPNVPGGGSQIFTHKGSGLVQQSERYQQRPYMASETLPGSGGQFDMAPNDFNKYNYADNGPYRVFPQNLPANNWQTIHKTHDINNQQQQMGNNPMEEGMMGGHIGQDYYYEEPYRNRATGALAQRYSLQQQTQQQQMMQQQQQSLSQQQQHILKSPEISAHSENKAIQEEASATGTKRKNTNEQSAESVTENPNEATTNKPKELSVHRSRIQSSHRKLEKLTAEVTVRETSFTDTEMEGHSTSPSGAILSLTFGLCITGIMVVLVGCRMRMVQRRIRRGGKSPYAHDADFLVNGMYL